MATIDQAKRRVGFAPKPPVKIAEGGKRVPLAAEEARRVPPGQFVTERFATLHREAQDELPTPQEIARWTLTVDGAVERPLTLTLEQLKRLGGEEITADFHCVTSWTRLDNRWRGVKIKDVLALANPKPHGRHVTQTAYSGHTTSTPIEEVLDDDALIAWEHDGKPLPLEHGAPLRIVLPKRYAYKGVKWVKRLTVTADEELGFWEQNGYSQTADPWKNDRYR